MPDFKMTYMFAGTQRQSGSTDDAAVTWTETWYLTETSLEAALIFGSRLLPGDFLTERLDLLADQYSVKWLRASSTNIRRVSKTIGMPGDIRGHATNSGGTGAQVNCAVLVDLFVPPASEADAAHHRRLMIRGLPRSIINGNILNESSGSFGELISFLNVVGGYRAPRIVGAEPVNTFWKVRTRAPTSTIAPLTALSVVEGNDRRIQITAALGALTRGQEVELRGVKFPLRVNRFWRSLADYAGPPYTLTGSRSRLAGEWDGTGDAVRPTWLYRQPSQYTIIGLRSRQTRENDPFHPSPGRRSRR